MVRVVVPAVARVVAPVVVLVVAAELERGALERVVGVVAAPERAAELVALGPEWAEAVRRVVAVLEQPAELASVVVAVG